MEGSSPRQAEKACQSQFSAIGAGKFSFLKIGGIFYFFPFGYLDSSSFSFSISSSLDR